MRRVFLAATMVLSVAFYGCAATKVERIKSEETVDLSGNWNDSDSRMVADKMIGQSSESRGSRSSSQSTGGRAPRRHSRSHNQP